MKLKNSLVLFILLVITLTISAQSWNSRRYELFYGIGISNFMGDIASPTDPNKHIWMHFFNTIGPMGNIGLRYQLQNRHYFKSTLALGQFYAEDVPNNPNWNYRGYKMSSFFTELSIQYEFLIFKEKNRKTVFKQLGETPLKNFSLPTYLFIGLGGVFNAGSLTNLSGQSLQSESFTNISPAIPMGLGIKFRFSRYTYGNIETGFRLTFNDGIDNAKGSENNSFGEYMDQYQFFTINLIHKIKSTKNGFPKLKTMHKY